MVIKWGGINIIIAIAKNTMENKIKIDYTVMGHDDITSDFLNWCMAHRDNLEYEKSIGVQELKSSNATLHFDDLGFITAIDRKLSDRRIILHY